MKRNRKAIMDENKNVKCGKCKSYKYPSQFLKLGRQLKTCSDCRERGAKFRQKNRCEHGRVNKSLCKDCGGSSICPHERQRSQCKECGGSSICPHDRVRSQCKECEGGAICLHGRQRSYCKECGGSSICTHGRQRSQCKECGGSSICTHGRQRSKCKECGGSSICTHDRVRSQCKECEGGAICLHGRQRSYCKECGGSSICTHGRRKNDCKECDFSGYLAHIVRSRVYDALKHNKELSSKEYLGCDVPTLKEHIEKQFTEGMSWDNYGLWHIDHVIPLKYDNPTLEETCERLHYLNTQPLWAEENISKGNRYIGKKPTESPKS